MKSKLVLGITALMLSLSTPVMAQDSGNRVAANTDWSVFTETNPKECWSVSQPKKTINTRGGQPAEVKRGDILLYVTFRPGKSGVVSFAGGYPFKPNSTVSLTIGSKTYQLFVKGEHAWARPEDDAKIIAAMKRGADAVLVGQSKRGTRTEDRFSLLGFTASLEDAAKRCAN